MNKQQITKRLRNIGAAWATSDEKYICTNSKCCNHLEGDRPAYHIHPDALEPRESYICAFTSLAGIAEYIRVRERMNAAPTDAEALRIWDDYNS